MKPAIERLRAGYIVADNGCWIWQGLKNKDGYGKFGYEGKTWYAHRFSYFFKYGEIPKDKELHHTCNNRACVNPDHLMVLSRNDHVAVTDRLKNSHCSNGHAYDEANTRIYFRNGRPIRVCRTCRKRIMAKHYSQKTITPVT